MINTSRFNISLWTCIVFLLLPTICEAQQGPSQTASEAEPSNVDTLNDSNTDAEIEIVIRFSKGLFESLTKQDIEMTIPISRTVEGISATGSAVGRGKTNIQLTTSDTVAEFTIDVPGTADASFSADAGPATAHSSAVVDFFGSKRIAFDGKQFSQGPTTTSTNSRTCVNQICPRRRGPIGRIVKRVGWWITRNNIGEINQIVDEVANEILAETFDKAATEIIAELNKSNSFEETVVKYFPETQSHVIHLATQPDSILAGAGAPGASFPDLPPAKAQIEVWLKTRPLEAAFLEMLAEWNIAHDVLREYLPDDDAKLIADDLDVETINGWSVIQIGIEKKKDRKKK